MHDADWQKEFSHVDLLSRTDSIWLTATTGNSVQCITKLVISKMVSA